MRELLRVEVARVAREMMSRILPMFHPHVSEKGGQSDCIFKGQPSLALGFFVSFNCHSKRDAFTVELAWSEKNRWPKDLSDGIPRDWLEFGVKKSSGKDGEYRFRLPKLWEVPKKDSWWEVVPRPTMEEIMRRSMSPHDLSYLEEMPMLQASLKLNGLMEDAMGKCVEFGVPYFAGVARERGIVWPGRQEL